VKRYGYKFVKGGGGWGIGIFGLGILIGFSTGNMDVFRIAFFIGVTVLLIEILRDHFSTDMSISQLRYKKHIKDAETHFETKAYEHAIESLRRAEIYDELSKKHLDMRDDVHAARVK